MSNNTPPLARLIERANAEITALSQGKKTWRTCIPAQPNDSDVVIGDAVIALKARAEALETALAALLERTPYTEYDFCGCAYCGCDYDAPHEEGCAWAQARKLLEVKE
jgi:hypothetical protein